MTPRRLLNVLLFVAVLGITCTSCYRAPGENDYSTIPATNNPGITRHANTFQPGMAY
ncbi:MAG: hypothetical protein Q8K75_11990 [Chlamydiales bacterium]|nr:hypothetical protein [Chlamydiales bacterium]